MKITENKFGYVDAMRGIAILMVILVHAAHEVPNLSPIASALSTYGQMGVQLFFVASAFTLCLSFDHRLADPLHLSSFYIRRFFRIAPLYYFAIPLYFIVFLFQQHYEFDRIITFEPYTIPNIIANLLLIHGFVPSANNHIVPGGWSIGTEVAFYVCFPILFMYSKKLSHINPKKLLAFPAVIFAANLLAQFVIARTTGATIQNNNFIYYNIVNELPVFTIGIVAYFLHRDGYLKSVTTSPRWTFYGFFICTVIPLLGCNTENHIIFVVIPTISALSFFFLLNWLKAGKEPNALLCSIGRVSYSMYIFHYIFSWHVMPNVLYGYFPYINPDIMMIIAFLYVSALSYMISLISEKYIESKGIAAGSRLIAYLQKRVSLNS